MPRPKKTAGPKRVVCVITGTGLKDPETASRLAEGDLQVLPPALPALEQAMGLS